MNQILSDERITEIRRGYHEAKKVLGGLVHSTATMYFSRTDRCIPLIEKPLGSLMSWAYGDFESIEDRDPREMVSKPVVMHVLFEGLLDDMVSYGHITKEQAAELAGKSRLATVGHAPEAPKEPNQH